MSSKRKRGQRWCKADSEHAANSTSGCKHAESKCTIVFADIGKAHPDIEDRIIMDVREPLSVTEVNDYANMVDAEVVVQVSELTPPNGRPMDELAEARWCVSPTPEWKCEDSDDMIKTDTGKMVGRVVILRQASEEIRVGLVRLHRPQRVASPDSTIRASSRTTYAEALQAEPRRQGWKQR